jgi:hypothetical protein
VRNNDHLSYEYYDVLGDAPDAALLRLVRDLDAVSTAGRKPEGMTVAIQAALSRRIAEKEGGGWPARKLAVPAWLRADRTRQAPQRETSANSRGRSGPLTGRALGVAGLATFVLVVALIGVGLAVLLPRMQGRPQPAERPARHGLPDMVNVTHFSEKEGIVDSVQSMAGDSEESKRLVALVQEVLQRTGEAVPCACTVLADRIKQSMDSIEIEYRESGVTVPKVGPYSRVLLPLSGRNPASGTDVSTGIFPVLLGDGQYTQLRYASATEQLNAIRSALALAALQPTRGPGAWSVQQPGSLLSEFIAVAERLTEVGAQRAPDARLVARVRSFLTPGYSARVQDLQELRVPTIASTGADGGRIRILRSVAGGTADTAEVTVAYLFYNAPTYMQAFALRKVRGEWRIDGVAPPRQLPLAEVVADRQLRKFEEEKIRDVAGRFVTYGVAAVTQAGGANGARAKAAEATARAYLAPGYESGISDLGRVAKVRANGTGYAMASGPGELQLQGDRAALDMIVDVNGEIANVLLHLQYLDGRWKITAVEPAELRPVRTPQPLPDVERNAAPDDGLTPTVGHGSGLPPTPAPQTRP